jgi:uncharacterized protein YdhG (YjbR/CyaY superfamily)
MTMDTPKKAPTNFDEYIAAFPEDAQERLRAMRETIRNAAPQAEEIMSYGVPGFRLKKNLVQFGAAKNHIGFYPTPGAIEAFQEQLAAYPTSKGAVQFPFDKPLPLDLVSEIVKFRIEQVVGK